MNLAFTGQKFQDWFTQQWIILWGKRIEQKNASWLIGPIGEIGIIADDFISQLANDEGLIIQRGLTTQGLLPSIAALNFSDDELSHLSKNVISFYENTSNHKLSLTLKWNPFFRMLGILVDKLFSKRIGQLNIPTKNIINSEEVNSEIITLSNPIINQVKYTIWFRTIKSNGQIIFSGIYDTCTLPNGKKCVKAIFPLPKGNATFILSPSVGTNGELILDSSGKKFGDPGFYFLLKDSKANYWAHYHSSFRDKLIVSPDDKNVLVEHTQTLWNQRVLKFKYQIKAKE